MGDVDAESRSGHKPVFAICEIDFAMRTDFFLPNKTNTRECGMNVKKSEGVWTRSERATESEDGQPKGLLHQFKCPTTGLGRLFLEVHWHNKGKDCKKV
jgi:hypothetical protein